MESMHAMERPSQRRQAICIHKAQDYFFALCLACSLSILILKSAKLALEDIFAVGAGMRDTAAGLGSPPAALIIVGGGAMDVLAGKLGRGGTALPVALDRAIALAGVDNALALISLLDAAGSPVVGLASLPSARTDAVDVDPPLARFVA
jgi:hypothetical protein